MQVAKTKAAFNVVGLMCKLLFIVIGFTKFNKLMDTWFALLHFLQMSFRKLGPA